MGMSGKFKGDGSDTYSNAHRFFMKRQLKGIAPPRKKAKTAATKALAETGSSKGASKKTADSTNYDVSGVELEDYRGLEAAQKVPIFETCNSIRNMINAHLRNTTETQASFNRQLSAILGTKVQGVQLTRFLEKKGPISGAGSSIFYASYIYFEKLRIKQGKKKSAFRLEMEAIWKNKPLIPHGVPREDSANKFYWASQKDSWSYNKYGEFVRN